jgi:nicotinamidase-related amidase
VRDALLLVDVVNDFRHEGADSLLASFRTRHGGIVAALERARARGIPVVYANDNFGEWHGDASRLVREAVERGRAGDLVAAIAPQDGDRFVVKPR